MMIEAMNGAAVSTVGLVFDIIGVLLLWWFGLPEALMRSGFGYTSLDPDTDEEKARAAQYRKWSRVALILLVGGFLLQILAQWL